MPAKNRDQDSGADPGFGSQPAGDVSHKPGGRLPLLSARPEACSYPGNP